MRKLFLILNTLICFELIALPMVPSLSPLFISRAEAKDCGAGLVWSDSYNNCIVKTSTSKALSGANECENSENKEECYKKNAMNQMSADSQKDKNLQVELKGNGLTNTTTAIATAGAMAIAIAGMKDNQSTCSSASYWLMIGGAATLATSDLIANITHDTKINAVRKKWGKIIKGDEELKGDKDKIRIAGIEAQGAAFGLLAESEDAMVKTAKVKSLMFKIAGAAFAASAVAAGLEMINPVLFKTAVCQRRESKKVKPLAPLKPASLIIPKSSPYIPPTLIIPKSTPVIQFINNLKNSEDLPSLLINQQAIAMEYQSPSIEDYEKISNAYSGLEVDESILSMIKNTMISIAVNMAPIQVANAESNSEKVYDHYEKKKVLASSLSIGSAALVGSMAGLLNVSNNFLKTQEWLTTAPARIAFSGVLSGLSFKLASDASKQAKASKARGDHLRKMEKDLIDTTNQLAICKSEDRNDHSKPHCYCYTPDNYPNPSRQNSKICQGLYAGNTDIKPGEYHTLPTASSTCVNNSYNTDPGCACKKTNTCMKLNLSGIKALNPGVFSVTGNAVSPVQDIANGTYDPANVSPASLANNAAKLDALMKKIEKHPALTAYAKNKDKMQNEMMNSLSRGAASLPSGSMASSGMNSSFPKNPAEAAKQLDEELKKPAYTGEETPIGVAGASPTESPDFGLGDADFNNQEDQIAEVMNKDFEYGENDINNGSSTNLFEVLSNRYQRSGLRRLFDEKGVVKPEAPSKSDITQ